MKSISQRFWEKVSIKEPNECWEWQSTKNNDHYGRFRIQGVRYMAHRVSFEFAHGAIPEGLVVRHSCDNPSCVNPNHLEIGTMGDNNADKVTRGRQAKGERHGRSKLTEATVRLIKAAEGSQRNIAKTFEVSQSTVRAIKAGHSWSHIQ